MSCSDEEGHPKYQNGSGVDPGFAEGELLFRRYKKEHYQGGQLLAAAFKFPSQSFNRQKYSKPEDVLHPDCCKGADLRDWGVLECSSTDLPTPIPGTDNRTFHFSAEHVPQECCYAHTVLLCTCGGVVVDKPSPKVREIFRVLLSQRMKVRIEATA